MIVGHSERRAGHHESDALVGEKAAAAIRHGLVPVMCVGETAEDLAEHGPSAIPVAQLRAALAGLSAGQEFVVAYEPVWAIGSGQPATPEQAEQVCAALRATIVELLGEDAGAATRVLYGGSVTSETIRPLMDQPNIDGALVGGASLKVEEFSRIVRFPQHIGH